LFNYRLLITVFVLIFATAAIGILRLDIDTDIARSLPADETVISDALEIFNNHPIHDQIAVDITLNRENPDTLVACGKHVENRLRSSTLFAQVGNSEISSLIPDLALHVATNLPILFSEQELEEKIAPRLEKEFISNRFHDIFQKLSSLEGIGQSRFIAADPLGFMEPIMAKMAMLAPLPGTRIHQGFVFSPDNRHLLVTARPETSGTNTASARQISELLDDISTELAEKYRPEGVQVSITPVGAYRAALDNEKIIRHDVNLALLLSTAGIGLLLFIAFPRPLLGLFSLLPALAGTAVALCIFSLLHSSISIMVLGFGGAIISITVDHGIAYLLFLDRPIQTKGKEASREILAIGILAVLTTCGAFLTLSFSGFPIFVQLGQFAALGVLFSFLFVHFIFPHITPSMPPSTRRKLPLQGLVDTLYSTGRTGALLAALLALSLLFFARPEFNVSLESMNTVSSETLAADKFFADVWGNISNKIVLMTTGDSMAALQNKNDQILRQITEDKNNDRVQSAFVPSMIFPGDQQATENLAAWKQFWNKEKIEKLHTELKTNGAASGFAEDAFKQFLKVFLPSFTADSTVIPSRFHTLMGISENDSHLTQFINVSPGKNYNSKDFFLSYGKEGKIFDSAYFSAQLADILFHSFTTMFAIIALSIAILLLFFFASWQLTLITLLPPSFSYICTLGTMKLIGHPLDIPGLMLSIVILGMGIDYSIFFVRAHQRYRHPKHHSFTLVRMAVFMAGASTMIGFGVLCLAEHSLLRSIGITSLLGIGYSLLGAFLLLPPLLDIYFSNGKQKHSNKLASFGRFFFDRINRIFKIFYPDNHVNPVKNENPSTIKLSLARRVRNRYRFMEAYPRMFARFKLQTDPMFADLPELLAKNRESVKTILDIGCGYGVPGCWCLEFFPNATLIGLDPDPERVRVAALAMGERGQIVEDAAADLPALENPADLVLLLDMLHYLDDKSITTLFTDCCQALNNEGLLLIRVVIQPEGSPSWSWKLEDYRIKLSGAKANYRSAERMTELMKKNGFHIESSTVSKKNAELIWLIGRADKK